MLPDATLTPTLTLPLPELTPTRTRWAMLPDATLTPTLILTLPELTPTLTRWAMLPDASMRAVLDRGGAQGAAEYDAERQAFEGALGDRRQERPPPW